VRRGLESLKAELASAPAAPFLSATIVQSGLRYPWDIAFAPDGRMFVTERDGNILVYASGAAGAAQLANNPIALIHANVEAGAMGLAIDPNFATNHFVYVCASRDDGGWLNQVLRYREANNILTLDGYVIRQGMYAGPNHDGCRIRFGPDGKLWVTMGEVGNMAFAQNPNSLNGKVLRVNSDGTIPDDNPILSGAFGRTAAYTMGHRNPQGIAFQPGTGLPFTSEHAHYTDTSTGAHSHATVNLLKPGLNFSWPNGAGPGFTKPVWQSLDNPMVAVSGNTFVSGAAWGAWDGNLFISTLLGKMLLRLEPQPDGTFKLAQTLFVNIYGRLRAATQSPDGSLYLSTDNGSDNIIRVTPAVPLVTSLAPQGSWVGTYGADGYALLGWNGSTDLAALGTASLVIDQGTRFQWRTSSTAVRDLQSPDGTSRRATAVYDTTQLRLHLNFATAYTGTLHLYALDASTVDRREVITVNDGSGPRGATLGSAFDQGVWVHAPIAVAAGGSVTITIDRTAGYNAVLSAVLLGGAAAPAVPNPPTGLVATAASATQINLSWTASAGASAYQIQRSPDGTSGWTQTGTASTAVFSDAGLTASTTYYYRVIASNAVGASAPSAVASATTKLVTSLAPQGSWVGTYGADGYALLGWNGSTDLAALGTASLVIDQGTRFQWRTSSTAVRDLQSPDGTSRRATAVYDTTQLRLHLNFATAYTGTLHLYALDASTVDRREVITVNDGSGPRGATLGSAFDQGVWVHAPIAVAAGGSVTITIDRTAGYNAVLSGIFLR
jgi:glucose/arabinose dehydrogenase